MSGRAAITLGIGPHSSSVMILRSFIRSPVQGAVEKYCDEYVCLSVREDISGTTRAIFTKFLCMLHVSVARSSSDMFTIGRIACRREGVFFPIENALSAGKGGGSAQRGRSMLSIIALLLTEVTTNTQDTTA